MEPEAQPGKAERGGSQEERDGSPAPHDRRDANQWRRSVDNLSLLPKTRQMFIDAEREGSPPRQPPGRSGEAGALPAGEGFGAGKRESHWTRTGGRPRHRSGGRTDRGSPARDRTTAGA